MQRLVIGLVLSGAIGLLAYWRQSLTASGVVGAVLVGTSIFAFGGPAFGLLLITFFVLSSLLSRFRRGEKEKLALDKFDKTDQRDIGQALANGGMAMLLAIFYFFAPNEIILAAFVCSLATVNADTWATEIGVLSKSVPRSILNLRPVERGASGGITLLGTLATATGAAVIGAAAVGLLALEAAVGGRTAGDLGFWLILIAAIGGVAGSLFDSLLGATVQVMYYSEALGGETEQAMALDGTQNRVVRGLAWMTNDWVNFISAAFGAGIGGLLVLIF